MSKIRSIYYFDKKYMKEMISFLNVGDMYTNRIMFNPFILLHQLLPLKLKFLPESYVLKDKNVIKAVLTISPIKSGLKKIEILKLFFEENSYDEASELVQFAVSKYKAMGAVSVAVRVDDFFGDLLNMFTSRCGFSSISSEKLWQVNSKIEASYNKSDFRIFRNSDSKDAAELYNETLLPHFRPLLSCGKEEFRESLFKGLSYYSEYKYVSEDKKTGKINCCIIIKTPDNENYIIDVINSASSSIDVFSALKFAEDKIRKRQKEFKLYVKTKKYTNSGADFESAFEEHKFSCIQNKIVLTNSSAKVLKNIEEAGRYMFLGDFSSSSAMPT